uniref:Major facilitator superfamily domain containing 4A n=1 Tax=Strix occidentalis caurina TaxID=311401 RepID=A0A8D0F2B1_STROC
MWWDERVSARFRRNLQPTLTYWSVFFSFGLCIAFLGPTLLDLRCQTQSSLSQITWVFFSQQFCLLLGSCLGGVFKRTLAQSLFALFASSLAISLVFAIIPLCHNVVVLAVVMAVAGLAMGCIDTISNMQLVKIYQKDSAIFLQALHFFVGFGALLSPLIADPFLSDTNCILSNSTANASSNLPHIRKSLVPHHPGNLSHYDLPMKGMVVTRVSYAFWIMALINVGVLISFLLLLIFSHSVVFLFVGTASLGLFLSSTFPSMLAYTEDILQYKGCATTVLVTGAGIGEMVLQLLVGSIIHDQGSYSFLVCGMIFGGLAFTFYAFLLFFHRMYPKPSSGKKAPALSPAL